MLLRPSPCRPLVRQWSFMRTHEDISAVSSEEDVHKLEAIWLCVPLYTCRLYLHVPLWRARQARCLSSNTTWALVRSEVVFDASAHEASWIITLTTTATARQWHFNSHRTSKPEEVGMTLPIAWHNRSASALQIARRTPRRGGTTGRSGCARATIICSGQQQNSLDFFEELTDFHDHYFTSDFEF
jgi:hypothetical protein